MMAENFQAKRDQAIAKKLRVCSERIKLFLSDICAVFAGN